MLDLLIDMANMMISAIIPVYNGRRFLRQAVESVVQQTLPPAELILVDDGSTDGSLSVLDGIAAPFPIHRLAKQNGGQSSARNLGVQHAGGDLIAFLDQDDVWYPHHIRRLLEPFHDKPSLGWTYSNVDEIDEKGQTECIGVLDYTPGPHPKRHLSDLLGRDMFVLPSASLIRREPFLAAGGFDEELSGYEDDDLFLRLFRHGYGNEYIGEPLGQFRMSPTSSSRSPRMDRSRRHYADKLIHAFSNERGWQSPYIRDQIAPRFFWNAVVRYKQAVQCGDYDRFAECMQDALLYAPLMHLPVQEQLRLKLMARPALYRSALHLRRAFQV